MAVGWVDKEPWNNRRQMQIYVSSFSLLYVWSCPRFPQAKHTKSSLAGAQLLIVNVCPLAKRALIGWGGDVSCLCCSRGKFNLIWAVVSTLACRSQATSPTLVVVEQRVRGCAERALKLDFVPLCIITIARDPWCIAVSCLDCGQNDSATRKIFGACWAKP